jgi:hypothetical protein
MRICWHDSGRGDAESLTVAAPERKTGVKRAEVITARLVQDERGSFQLACWERRSAQAFLEDGPERLKKRD